MYAFGFGLIRNHNSNDKVAPSIQLILSLNRWNLTQPWSCDALSAAAFAAAAALSAAAFATAAALSATALAAASASALAFSSGVLVMWGSVEVGVRVSEK